MTRHACARKSSFFGPLFFLLLLPELLCTLLFLLVPPTSLGATCRANPAVLHLVGQRHAGTPPPKFCEGNFWFLRQLAAGLVFSLIFQIGKSSRNSIEPILFNRVPRFFPSFCHTPLRRFYPGSVASSWLHSNSARFNPRLLNSCPSLCQQTHPSKSNQQHIPAEVTDGRT